MLDQRRRDLESHVQKTLVLIREYEEQLRLSDDPRQQREAEREIARLRQLLASYQAELSSLDQADASPVQVEFVNREVELSLHPPRRAGRIRQELSPAAPAPHDHIRRNAPPELERPLR